jgi:uncharacterized protein with HEPN domain
MSASNFELVRHMLIEAEFILEHVHGKSKTEVLNDEVLCRALVRSLEIIGEAAKKLRKSLNQTMLISNGRRCLAPEIN